jgi:crossover junction endodeoxyribonuclease RusA
VTLTLPFPPSVNTYWRRVGSRTVLSAKAREYRGAAIAACLEQSAPRLGPARVRVSVIAYPPDRRRRDLDNLHKGILDALTFACIFDDDSQIDELSIIRAYPEAPGRVLVTVEALS